MGTKFNLANKTKAFDELFRSTSEETNQVGDVFEVDIEQLQPFPNHPFKPYEGEKLEKMVESVKQFGVITPIIIKAVQTGYMIISGHNRVNAAKIAGLKTVKAVAVDVDEDNAAMMVVESNFRQRDSMLHSEKALAYKMKYDAVKRRGKRTDLAINDTPSGATRDIIGDEFGENGKQVQRYLRIAILVPQLLALLDSGRLGFTQAVELSYLPEFEQQLIVQYLESNSGKKLSCAQAKTLRKLYDEGKLDADSLGATLVEHTNTIRVLKLKANDLKVYLPPGVTSEDEMLSFIRNALEYYKNNK